MDVTMVVLQMKIYRSGSLSKEYLIQQRSKERMSRDMGGDYPELLSGLT